MSASLSPFDTEEKEKDVGDHVRKILGNMSSKLGSMFSSTPTPPPTALTPTAGGRKSRKGKSRKGKSRKGKSRKGKSRKCSKCTRARKCARCRKSSRR